MINNGKMSKIPNGMPPQQGQVGIDLSQDGNSMLMSFNQDKMSPKKLEIMKQLQEAFRAPLIAYKLSVSQEHGVVCIDTTSKIEAGFRCVSYLQIRDLMGVTVIEHDHVDAPGLSIRLVLRGRARATYLYSGPASPEAAAFVAQLVGLLTQNA